jgi:hypothetical protein
MATVKRPLDKKIEGKVPPVEAKDGPDETETGGQPDDEKEKK